MCTYTYTCGMRTHTHIHTYILPPSRSCILWFCVCQAGERLAAQTHASRQQLRLRGRGRHQHCRQTACHACATRGGALCRYIHGSSSGCTGGLFVGATATAAAAAAAAYVLDRRGGRRRAALARGG